jgi:hypothetical protein
MYSPEYDDLEDFYPDNSMSTALLEYLCHAFCNCFKDIYRQSPVHFSIQNDYPSDSESIINEETFLYRR